MRKAKDEKPQAEYGLLGIFAGLALVGLFSVACASYVEAYRLRDSQFYFTKRHILYLVVSLVGAFFCSRFKPGSWKPVVCYIFFGVTAVFALMVFIPGMGVTVNGAQRWVQIGPLQIQPSEFLKLGMIVGMAAWLTTRKGNPRRLSPGFFIGSLMMVLSATIVLKQDDLGTVLVLLLTGYSLLVAAGARSQYLLGLGGLLVLLAVGAVVTKPYRIERVKAWLAPWEHKRDESYQVTQSFYAFGEGGWR
ncbi:MAG: FtsW/RodA/SpoVE family cell cycle protein, partial [Armatimonadota bacterium]